MRASVFWHWARAGAAPRAKRRMSEVGVPGGAALYSPNTDVYLCRKSKKLNKMK
jgi:hypothetical protein